MLEKEGVSVQVRRGEAPSMEQDDTRAIPAEVLVTSWQAARSTESRKVSEGSGCGSLERPR
jgi:hypothetical protein